MQTNTNKQTGKIVSAFKTLICMTLNHVKKKGFKTEEIIIWWFVCKDKSKGRQIKKWMNPIPL